MRLPSSPPTKLTASKERILAALATLTTQGRAAGYCVIAALQDPRKEVLNIRNLFPDKIALRLDEPGQADMILGAGARVGFVGLEADPDPVRVRAAWVTDDDIRDMALHYGTGRPDGYGPELPA